MSRYDRPSHPVYMHFFKRGGWQVQFLEPDLKTPLPRKLTFTDPEKIRELARRGEAWVYWRFATHLLWQHVPALNGLDQEQSRQSALLVDESQMLSANLVSRRDHVPDGIVGRLQNHEENLVYHVRTEKVDGESLRPPGK
jgi:hypothetical protein